VIGKPAGDGADVAGEVAAEVSLVVEAGFDCHRGRGPAVEEAAPGLSRFDG
jgi:hypothetical protein